MTRIKRSSALDMTLMNRRAATTATAMKMEANTRSALVMVFPAAQSVNARHQVCAHSLVFTSTHVASIVSDSPR